MSEKFQATVAGPGFRIGISCDEAEILKLKYLEPGPFIAPQNALAAEAVRQLDAYMNNPEAAFSLPLRPSGTTFQRRVWAQIAKIPSHQTRTYGELAKALHNAPRAIGQACGANPFPLVVPCHRVVGSTGTLTGYHWGLTRKRAILGWEAGQVAGGEAA